MVHSKRVFIAHECTLPDCYHFDTYQHRYTIHSIIDLSNAYFKIKRKVEEYGYK